jgi:hypothetical protein
MRLRDNFLSAVLLLLLLIGSLCCHPKNQTHTAANSSAQSQDQPKSVLSIEVGLVYKSGDAKPVARNEFYILDEDAEQILRDAKVEKKGKLKKHDLRLLDTYGLATLCVSSRDICNSLKDSLGYLQDSELALKPHVIQRVVTGFDGKAKFEPMPTGNYYLMGVYVRERGYVIWNLKVELKSETQNIILDQNNANLAF